MGYIVDAVAQDILLNSNVKTIEAATSYWTGNVNAVVGQEAVTKAAINRARDVAVQVIANVTATNMNSFTFTGAKCYRDTGLIVDALAQDLLFEGTSQSTFAGIQYWNHGNYVGRIASELSTTTSALTYLSSVAQKVVRNVTSGPRYQNTVTQYRSEEHTSELQSH